MKTGLSKAIFGTLSVLLLHFILISCVLPAGANSAQTHWSGSPGSGVGAIGEDCPLVVQTEKLTFRIGAFPDGFFDADEDKSGKSPEEYASLATVTAEYTFYNPADFDVTATLAFPCGRLPEYADKTLFSLEARGVTVDGERVQTRKRYTYSGDAYQNDVDLKRLGNTYRDDSFFSPGLPVTFCYYEYRSNEEKSGDFITMTVKKDAGMRVFCPCNTFNEDGGELRFGFSIYEGSPYEIVFFGNVPASVVFSGAKRGEMTYLPEKTRTTTLGELALEGYDEKSGVSKTDWYNAYVDRLSNADEEGSGGLLDRDLGSDLMQWYEYELTVPAGGTVVNTVSVPLFPDIDYLYEPPVYNYKYLLSPAQTWAEFGTLEVTVDTPYDLIESGVGEFEKTDGGFRKSFTGLPEGELSFKMSSDPSPKKNMTHVRNILLVVGTVLAVTAAVIGVLTLAIVLTVRAVRKKNAKRKDLPSKE